MKAGWTEYVSYCVALMIPLATMLAAAFVALRLEGGPLTREAIRDRFRLRRMSRMDWLWTAGALLGMLVGGGIMSLVAEFVRQATRMPLPADLIPILDPRLSTRMIDVFKTAMGPQYLGDWGAVGLMLALLALNIFGEELWWRGYVLPRQELAFGSQTWLIHGILWAGFHAFKYWQVLALLPITLILSFVAQRRKNTWPGIITHSLANAMSLIAIVLIVTGRM
jgi:membrane protease YdiL (CAAX protease family)